jgi:hemoglobin-like flavoprotein
MGGAASSHVQAISNAVGGGSEQDIINFCMPIYYTSTPLLPHEKDRAIKCWKSISNGQAPEYFRLKTTDPVNTPCKTPMDFFGNRFYRRLLEVHPTCQSMFTKSTMKQGTLLLRMISFAISELDNDEKFEKTYRTLAQSHNRVGVKAVEYGIFGEVLFWTLKIVTGGDVYDSVCHSGWIKIYSKMLEIIIPEVVRYELANKPAIAAFKEKRLKAVFKADANGGSDTVILAGDAHEKEKSISSHSRMVSVIPT